MVLSAVPKGIHPSSQHLEKSFLLRPTLRKAAYPVRTNFHNIMDLVEPKIPQQTDSVFNDVFGEKSTSSVCVKREPQDADVIIPPMDTIPKMENEYEHVTRDFCFPTPPSTTTTPWTTGSSPGVGSTSFSSSSSLDSSPCRSPASDYASRRRPSVDLSDCSPEGTTSGGSKTDSTDSNKAKKGRTIYKAQQVFVLEQVFHRTQYPDPEVVETLARDLNISEAKIKIWFQNKRARWRRRGPVMTGPAPTSPFPASMLQVPIPNPTWTSSVITQPSMKCSPPSVYANYLMAPQNVGYSAAVPSITTRGQYPPGSHLVTSHNSYSSSPIFLPPSRPIVQL